MYTIYLITNLNTNEKYVGRTTRTLEQRLYEHSSPSSTTSKKLKEDMLKLGIEGFSIEPLLITDCLNELYEKENEFIELYDTHVNGYNRMVNRNGVKSKENKILPFVHKLKPLKNKIAKREVGANLYRMTNIWYSSFVKDYVTYRLGFQDTKLDAHIAYDIGVTNFYDYDSIKYLNYPEYLEIYKGIKIDKEKNLVIEIKKALRIFWQTALEINATVEKELIKA